MVSPSVSDRSGRQRRRTRPRINEDEATSAEPGSLQRDDCISTVASWQLRLAPRHVRGREGRIELGARGDAEFWEEPVEVRGDGAVGEVELLADLAVGEAGGCHLGDLEFLRCELVARVGCAAAGGLS